MVRSVLLYGLALLQATAIQALIVPDNLPDGLYTIPFNSAGEALSEPALVHSLESRVDRHRRQSNPPTLPASKTKCGTRGNININDFQLAKAAIQTACDKGEQYAASTAVVYTVGSSVAYFCNYQSANRCWRQEYEEAMARIVQSCGSGKGGEIYISAYSKSYGGDNAGSEICLGG